MQVRKALAGIAVGATTIVGGAVLIDANTPLTEKEIAKMQNEYFAENGEYAQILQGGVREKDKNIIRKFPKDAEVHVYDGPQGKGYVIIQNTKTHIIHKGYGNENRNKIQVRNIKIDHASTTQN